MIVIGADTHKGWHALAAVDEGTGRVRGQREIKADEPGHLAALRWARALDRGSGMGDRGLPDTSHGGLSRRCWRLASGSCSVAPHRMGASRKGEREPGKSDQIDALAVARAVVKDGVEQFPVAYLNEQAMEIRLLLDHRHDLVAERTRIVIRLRWHLLELCPELERSLKRGALNHARELDRVDRRLRKLPPVRPDRIAREQLVRPPRTQPRDRRAAPRAAQLINAHRPELLPSRAAVRSSAAILIGRTAGASDFKLGRELRAAGRDRADPLLLGAAPQHRLNRGGDRQLNRALHVIASPAPSVDPDTKEFLARKQAEGKTNKGALRCLKRHLARRFHRLLVIPAQTTQHAHNNGGIPERPIPRRRVDPTIRAATPMRCLT